MPPTSDRTPPLSVVMPVHDAEPFLDDSIGSILRQTWSDFELVLLDDASTDATRERLHAWAARDPRIRVFESRRRLGLVGSSNAVVSLARAPTLARMDADDISHPERLERQLGVLGLAPGIVAVGTLWVGIDASGRTVRPRDRWRLVRRSSQTPFPHGSAMFRRSAFDRIDGYREGLTGEDHDFFRRLTAAGAVVTLPDALYYYRYHAANASLRGDGQAPNAGARSGEAVASAYLAGAMRLWSGEPPRMLRALLAHRPLPRRPATIRALAYASWGAVHPASLRGALRGVIRTRDLIAGAWAKDGQPYSWRSR
jgi:glycosyltransferase involved in cell wall biosynthesis